MTARVEKKIIEHYRPSCCGYVVAFSSSYPIQFSLPLCFHLSRMWTFPIPELAQKIIPSRPATAPGEPHVGIAEGKCYERYYVPLSFSLICYLFLYFVYIRLHHRYRWTMTHR